MGNINFIKIKSIKYVGKFRTYDVSVKGNHNFLLNNELLSHNSQDLTFLGRISQTSRRDRMEIADTLYGVGTITKAQIKNLHTLRKGEFFLIEGEKHARRVYLFLPRTMYWKEGDGNFYNNVWKKYIDKWNNTEEDKKILVENYKKRQTEIKIEKKLKEVLKHSRIEESHAPSKEIPLAGEQEKSKNSNLHKSEYSSFKPSPALITEKPIEKPTKTQTETEINSDETIFDGEF